MLTCAPERRSTGPSGSRRTRSRPACGSTPQEPPRLPGARCGWLHIAYSLSLDIPGSIQVRPIQEEGDSMKGAPGIPASLPGLLAVILAAGMASRAEAQDSSPAPAGPG